MWKKYGKNFCVFIFLKKKKGHISILPNLTKVFGKEWNLPSTISEFEQILLDFFNALTTYKLLFCLMKCPSEMPKYIA